jgi:ankyrin repeat protein
MKKNFFESLPADLRREVSYFLKYRDIQKVPHTFYDDINDVYWKVLCQSVTNEEKPENESYQSFYESFIYKKPLSKVCNKKSYELFEKFMDDEVFFLRHINARDKHENTALNIFCSIDYFNEEYVTKLLLAGATINIYDNLGRTPLKRAVVHSLSLVKKLIAHGADVNFIKPRDYSPLIIAAEYSQKEIIELLINKGADVNYQTNYGITALMVAADYGCTEIVELLLDAGADVNLRTKYDDKAFVYAKKEEIKLLLV